MELRCWLQCRGARGLSKLKTEADYSETSCYARESVGYGHGTSFAGSKLAFPTAEI